MAPLTHVLFDFFGTLVRYSPSRVEQGYDRSHDLLRRLGSPLGYDEFLASWDGVCAALERDAEESHVEYSMDQACSAFLQRALPQPPAPATVELFRDTYVDEWNKGVHYIDGVVPMLEELAERHTLVLVTNTHHAAVIRGHLRQMKAEAVFRTVVTSVELGRRKPSPAIFRHALALSGGTAEASVYVGDTYTADYLGAAGAGIRCLLLDPERTHAIPESDRLAGILDLRQAVNR